MSIINLNGSLSFGVFLISLITLLEVFIQFKKPVILKRWICLFLFSALIHSFTYFIQDFSFTTIAINNFSRSVFVISFLNFTVLLLNKEYSKWANILSAIILMGSMITIYAKIKIYHTYFTGTYDDFFINPTLNIPIWLAAIRYSITIGTIILLIGVTLNGFKKYAQTNIYHIQLKSWTTHFLITLILFIATFIIIQRFFQSNGQLKIFLLNTFILYITLIILFRPKFINISSIRSVFSELFNKQTFDQINDKKFIEYFFQKCYFLQKDASLENFAKTYDFDVDDMYRFIYQNFQMSFNDLINKNRIEYFIEIAKENKYKNFTIEALAKESGFSSRHHLYKPFKKFHGGNPSDFIDNIHIIS